MVDKELLDLLNDIEDDRKEESKLSKSLKRAYVLIIVVAMVSLLLINTNAGYHLISLFSGKIVSSTIDDDYNFDLKFGGKAIFRSDVYKRLLEIYFDNEQHEFKVCLTGHTTFENYVVTGLYMPKIYAQDVYSVTSQMCNNSTIISLHSHPAMRCIFSEQDIKSFDSFRSIRDDGIIALMCGEDRMTFYGYS